MKICYVITGLGTGGAEGMLFRLLQHIDPQRFVPHVISLTSLGEYGPRLVNLGIDVQTLGMEPGRIPTVQQLLRLVRTFKAMAPDVVSTWMYHADLLGGVAARLAGVRAVAWNLRHSDLTTANNKRSTLFVVRLCAALSPYVPKCVLTCSRKGEAEHVNIGYRPKKIVVLPNGFELDRFKPNEAHRRLLRAELGICQNSPLVGMFARDDPSKNHLGFMEAARKVHQSDPRVHFLMAGTGIDRHNGKLCAAIDRAGLGESVHLLGRRDDMPRLMAAIDVLASASSGEAFPNVLGEAMACAVPCVATNAGDSAEIVGDTGRIVPVGDMDCLAKNIVELVRFSVSERAKLGARARERIRLRFEIGAVARQYENVFFQLLREA
jgi:glycosyltransferase involved in cell wall biosynthesis